jgi:hypothetical protein
MKRLIFIPLLIFSLTISAQFTKSGGTFLKSGNAFISTPTEDLYCDEYDAVLAAMTTDPSATNMGYQNTMVEALVDGGYWTRFGLFYVFATEINTGGEALINWKDPGTHDADNVGSMAWGQYLGYQGASNDYISTNWTPQTDSTYYKKNSGSCGIYLVDAVDGKDDDWAFNCTDNDLNHSIRLNTRSLDGTLYYTVNSLYYNQGYVANTITTGLFIITRRAVSGTASIQAYRNGSSIDSDNKVSSLLPNVEMTLLGNAINEYSLNQVAIFFTLNAVSTEEAAAINTIIEAYMDAIGTGVQ